MIPIEIETIFLLSQVIYFVRIYFQTKVSLKENQSVNPKIYWKLTILASILIGIYGYFIGSLIMVLTQLFGIVYSFFHMKIEDNIKFEYCQKCLVKKKPHELRYIFIPELNQEIKICQTSCQ